MIKLQAITKKVFKSRVILMTTFLPFSLIHILTPRQFHLSNAQKEADNIGPVVPPLNSPYPSTALPAGATTVSWARNVAHANSRHTREFDSLQTAVPRTIGTTEGSDEGDVSPVPWGGGTPPQLSTTRAY